MKKIANYFLASTAFTLRPVYENKAGWKLDENGAVVLNDGNPVYVNASGQEMTLGADTVSRLNAEAKQHRERAEAAEKALKPFDGLDPAAARSAIEVVGKLDQKALVDAGKVDEVKALITQQYEGQLAERDTKLNTVTQRYHETLLTNAFASSKFINESIAIPSDIFRASFGKNFNVDDNGNIVALDGSGNPLSSKKRIGETADFEEAISIMVDQYPHKDSILKAPSGGGSGSGGAGGQRPGGAVVRRSDFDAMTSAEKSAAAAKVRAGEVRLIDG